MLALARSCRTRRCRAAAIALVALLCGCARDRAEITPTTVGSDLSRLTRGRMTPLPFPGSDLVRRSEPLAGSHDGSVRMAGSSDSVRR